VSTPAELVHPPRTFKAKVCLLGARGVGKTSLVRRFVLNTFDDRYVATIGTKVSKKEIPVQSPSETPWSVDMTVWDIMGEKGFRELLKEAYFFGAQGLLAVADVTRHETIEDLDDWIEGALRGIGNVPVVVAANKTDLLAEGKGLPEALQRYVRRIGADCVPTSAKAGLGVEACFRALAGHITADRTAVV